jgi:hypothetical protein
MVLLRLKYVRRGKEWRVSEGRGGREPIVDERWILPSENTETDVVRNRDHTNHGAIQCQKTFDSCHNLAHRSTIRVLAAHRVSNCRERIQTTEKPSRKRFLTRVDMSCCLQQRSIGPKSIRVSSDSARCCRLMRVVIRISHVTRNHQTSKRTR